MKERGFDQQAYNHILNEFRKLNLSTRLQHYMYLHRCLGPLMERYEQVRDTLYLADPSCDPEELNALMAELRALEEKMMNV